MSYISTRYSSTIGLDRTVFKIKALKLYVLCLVPIAVKPQEKQGKSETARCNLNPYRKGKWSVSYNLGSGFFHPYPIEQDFEGVQVPALPFFSSSSTYAPFHIHRFFFFPSTYFLVQTNPRSLNSLVSATTYLVLCFSCHLNLYNPKLKSLL